MVGNLPISRDHALILIDVKRSALMTATENDETATGFSVRRVLSGTPAVDSS